MKTMLRVVAMIVIFHTTLSAQNDHIDTITTSHATNHAKDKDLKYDLPGLRLPPDPNQLTLTSGGLLGHGVINPMGRYHISYLSSASFPHIRITELDKTPARVIFENIDYPDISWNLNALNSPTSSSAYYEFFFEHSTEAGPRLKLTGDGQTGINTSNPQYNLDIRGSDNTTNGGELQLATPGETNFLRFFGGRLGDRNPFLAFSDQDSFHVVSTSENYATFARRMTFLPSGNIGIGNSQPSGKLHIQTNSNTGYPHLRVTEHTQDFARIKLENTAQPGVFWDIAGLTDSVPGDGLLNFYYSGPAGSSDLMSIRGNGRVGIGTPNPQADLHIKDEGFTYVAIDADADNDAILQFRDASATSNVDQWTIRRDGSDAGKLQWRHQNLQRMTMTTGGNLGIGITSPTEKLHVQGSMRVSDLAGPGDRNVIVDSDGKFTIGAVGNADEDWVETTSAVYNNSKNIGIGTASPSHKLSVVGEADSTAITIFSPFGSTIGGQRLELDGQGIDAYFLGFLVEGDDDLLLQTKSSQNVGVGVTNPPSKLTVAGADNDGTVAALEIRTASNGQKMLLDGNEIEVTGTAAALHLNAVSGLPVTIGSHHIAAGYDLSVAGKIMAEEVRVQLQAQWPDYVFEEGYDLMSLPELEATIKTQGHLPGIPPARQLAAEGIDTGEMQRLMMEKIEELTLHIIQLNKKIEQLESVQSHQK